MIYLAAILLLLLMALALWRFNSAQMKRNALESAIRNTFVAEELQKLLNANPTEANSEAARSALFSAITENNLGCMRVLLSAGVNANSRSEIGNVPAVFVAKVLGRPDAVSLLIEYGAKITEEAFFNMEVGRITPADAASLLKTRETPEKNCTC